MPRASTPRIPKYCHHKARNLARVTIDGRDIYLGSYDSPESHEKYDRLIAEWLLSRRVDPADGRPLTICELMVSYLQFALNYYIKDGERTSEFGCITVAMKPLRKLYESLPVTEFGPKALKVVRQQMIDDGSSRKYINAQIKRLQRMFKWGVSEELVPAAVYQALATVAGLRKGRTEAVERPPVAPVADAVIDQTLPHLPSIVADMVRLQRLCGARPGEVTKLRPEDIDRTTEVWSYRPGSHKTEHHQKQRVIFFGPQAQEILCPYLNRPGKAFCFSPVESEERRSISRRKKRRTPLYGEQAKTKPRRRRQLKDHYSSSSYRRAIHRACDRVGIERWSPNRIRHTIATEIRKKFGLEAAQTVLGHSNAAVTQIYAERDLTLASSVVKEVG